ncbi:hypothetical protein [Piscirickettsia salmonis]|uniref:hypothetical protein n=1 Tax=Piscirickettsia salmonis TaxID=1238 RepID=UPI0007C91ACA
MTSLDHLLNSSSKDNQYISAQNRFNYAIKICRLLDKLHSRTLSKSGTAYAHLDIKPGNITKDHQGQFHFIDLAACEKLDGIASSKHDNDHGTRAYLPKQYSRQDNSHTAYDSFYFNKAWASLRRKYWFNQP